MSNFSNDRYFLLEPRLFPKSKLVGRWVLIKNPISCKAEDGNGIYRVKHAPDNTKTFYVILPNKHNLDSIISRSWIVGVLAYE